MWRQTVAQIERLDGGGMRYRPGGGAGYCTRPKLSGRFGRKFPFPLIADIHFDYRLAIAAMEHGADGIRINPGNLGGEEKIARVVAAAKLHKVPIRVGVNSGSIEKDLLKTHGYPTPENTDALIESAMRNVRLLEKHGF